MRSICWISFYCCSDPAQCSCGFWANRDWVITARRRKEVRASATFANGRSVVMRVILRHSPTCPYSFRYVSVSLNNASAARRIRQSGLQLVTRHPDLAGFPAAPGPGDRRRKSRVNQRRVSACTKTGGGGDRV